MSSPAVRLDHLPDIILWGDLHSNLDLLFSVDYLSSSMW